jgi:tetratricopeptide (TPR) repeat protein
MHSLAATARNARRFAGHSKGVVESDECPGSRARLSILCLIATCGCQTPLLQTALHQGRPSQEPRIVKSTLTDADGAFVTSDTLFDRAVELRSAGRLNDARNTLAVLLQTTPDHFAAIDLLAEISRDLDDRSLYRASLQRLIELRPTSAVLLHRAGVELLELARVPAVAESPDKAANIQANVRITNHAQVAMDVEAGLQSLRQAVALESHNREFIQSLFGALIDLERRAEAETVLRQALKRNPRDAVLALTAARFYEAADDWGTALSYYDAALRNDPANRVWMRQRAVCHFRMGNLEAAAEDFDTALTGTPVTPQLAEYLMWSEACLNTGDYAAASRVLDRIVLTGNTRTAELEMLRSLCRLRLDSYSDAGKIIADAIVQWPKHAGLRRMAGQIEKAAARKIADAA